MPEQTYKCLVCRTVLPIDPPKSIKSIFCPFCSSPNPNPNNLPDGKPVEYLKPGAKTQTIELDESSISQLYSIFSITAGVVLFIFFAARQIPTYYLYLASVLVFLPIFSIYFVPAHWEKVCKWATSETGDKYQTTYTRLGVDWISYTESYIFQLWYFGRSLINITHPSTDDGMYLVWFAAIILSSLGLWILNLLVQTVARFLGLLISRNK